MFEGLTAFARVQVFGQRGWTAMPRLTLWLCVPGLICGAAALIVLSASKANPAAHPTIASLADIGAGVALTFYFAAFPLTPIAAILALVISTRRRWRASVVALLWCAVMVSMAMLLPAVSNVTKHLMARNPGILEKR